MQLTEAHSAQSLEHQHDGYQVDGTLAGDVEHAQGENNY